MQTFTGLAVTALSLLPLTALAAPAQAAPATPERGVACATNVACGDVYHVNAGAQKRIKVRCHSGEVQYLYKGQAATCRDVDKFYVYAGYEVWDRRIIRGTANWTKVGDATGWYDVWDIDNLNLKNVED